MPVFLDGGRRLGFVSEVGHAVDFLHVQQGHILIRDWYIPTSAVRTVSNQGVYLNVGAAELLRNRWNVPSAEYLLQQGATPGYEYTSPADIPTFGAGSPLGETGPR